MTTYRLKKEWAHHTLEEAFERRLEEALAWAARGERVLPYSRIPGLMLEVLEEVTGSSKSSAESTRSKS